MEIYAILIFSFNFYQFFFHFWPILQNQLQCTAEFRTQSFETIIFCFNCVYNSRKYVLYSY